MFEGIHYDLVLRIIGYNSSENFSMYGADWGYWNNNYSGTPYIDCFFLGY